MYHINFFLTFFFVLHFQHFSFLHLASVERSNYNTHRFFCWSVSVFRSFVVADASLLSLLSLPSSTSLTSMAGLSCPCFKSCWSSVLCSSLGPTIAIITEPIGAVIRMARNAMVSTWTNDNQVKLESVICCCFFFFLEGGVVFCFVLFCLFCV